MDHQEQPPLPEERNEGSASEEPLQSSGYVDVRKLAAERIRKGESVIAKRLGYFTASAAGVLGFLIVELDWWPAPAVREWLLDFGFKSKFLVLIPIGLGLMVLFAAVSSFIITAVERRKIRKELGL